MHGEDVRIHEYDDFGFTSTFVELGRTPRFHAWTHTHLSAELTLVGGGDVTFAWKGASHGVHPGEIVLFYSGFPHGLVAAEPDATLHIIQVPVVDVLSWPAPPGMLHRLFAGDFVQAMSTDLIDALAFARWHDELTGADTERKQPAQLEIEARIRRLLASDGTPAATRDRHVHGTTIVGVTAAARFIARHYVEPITVDDVATDIGWSRGHLLAAFRDVFGMPIAQYITRLRLAEAQRLLSTTALPVLAICHRAGFTSTVRMYDAFNRHLGTTPGAYRRAVAS